jgi:hypothetical protein
MTEKATPRQAWRGKSPLPRFGSWLRGPLVPDLQVNEKRLVSPPAPLQLRAAPPEKAPSRYQFFHACLAKDRLARTSVEMKIIAHVQDTRRRSFQFDSCH